MRCLPLLFLLCSTVAEAKMTVAVIDTGLDKSVVDLYSEPNDSWYEKGICKYGHKSFANSLYDDNGHGTNISGLIHKYAEGADYCQVIITYYEPHSDYNAENMIKAIEHAVNIKVDVINISGGGIEGIPEEKAAIKRALDAGIVVITAAGNEGKSYDEQGYYPALYYPEIIVVGSKNRAGDRLPSSNYSNKKEIDYYENGFEEVGVYGRPLTGTSQATAIRTGKEIRRIYNDAINKYLIKRRTA